MEDNIIVTGTTRYFGARACSGECEWVSGTTIYRDILTIKYDPNGNMLWNKTSSGVSDKSFDSGQDVAVDSNNNIIVTGYTEYLTAIKNYETDILGNATYYIVEGVEAAYYTTPPFKRNYQLWTIKYSPSGNLIWNKTAGGSERDMGYGVAVDSNNNIIVVGETHSFGAGNEDVWIIKYGVEGKENGGEQDWRIYLIIGIVIMGLILLFLLVRKWKKAMMK